MIMQSATSTIPSTTVDKTTAGSTREPRTKVKLTFGKLKTVLVYWLVLVIGMLKQIFTELLGV